LLSQLGAFADDFINDLYNAVYEPVPAPWTGLPGIDTYDEMIEAVDRGVLTQQGALDMINEADRINAEARAAGVADDVNAANEARRNRDHLSSWHRNEPTDAEVQAFIDEL